MVKRNKSCLLKSSFKSNIAFILKRLKIKEIENERKENLMECITLYKGKKKGDITKNFNCFAINYKNNMC